MATLLSHSKAFAAEELAFGMIAFQRTGSMPAAAMAVSADMMLRAVRHILNACA